MPPSTAKKRGLGDFFLPVSYKRARVDSIGDEESLARAKVNFSRHSSYPFPVPYLPSNIYDGLSDVPGVEGREIRGQADLDLLYFQNYIPQSVERALFEFLRRELFYYRVQYKIKRGTTETLINTPR